MKNPFESTNPEIKTYGTHVEKRAKISGFSKENIDDTKATIKKEDVIESDAYYENELRNLLKANKITQEEFNEEISNLLISSVDHPTTIKDVLNDNELHTTRKIKGEVNKQKINLKFEYIKTSDGRDVEKYSGTINEKPLSEEEARYFFIKYFELTERRDKNIKKTEK